jgi:hypothetical protein
MTHRRLFFEIAFVSTKTWLVQKLCPLLLALFVFSVPTGQLFWPLTRRRKPSLPIFATKFPQDVLVDSSMDFTPLVPIRFFARTKSRQRSRHNGSTPDRAKTKPYRDHDSG